jgi:lysozyme
MTPSKRIKDFVKGYEALRLKAYKPTADDVWTIGYGHTQGVKAGDVWTAEHAEAVFDAEMNDFGADVLRFLPGPPATSQNRFDAMVSLAFNIGIPNFKTSSVLTNHRAGHYQTAAMAFSLWIKQRTPKGLVVLNGLVKRRAAEAAIYRGE